MMQKYLKENGDHVEVWCLPRDKNVSFLSYIEARIIFWHQFVPQ